MDLDDFRGSCGSGKYPLVKSMTAELAGYRVGLEYDGPYEGTANGGVGKGKKDRKLSGWLYLFLIDKY